MLIERFHCIIIILCVPVIHSGFTKWLNFVLAPTDEFGNPLSTIGKTGIKIIKVNSVYRIRGYFR